MHPAHTQSKSKQSRTRTPAKARKPIGQSAAKVSARTARMLAYWYQDVLKQSVPEVLDSFYSLSLLVTNNPALKDLHEALSTCYDAWTSLIAMCSPQYEEERKKAPLFDEAVENYRATLWREFIKGIIHPPDGVPSSAITLREDAYALAGMVKHHPVLRRDAELLMICADSLQAIGSQMADLAIFARVGVS